MNVNQNKALYVVLQVIGVLAAVILIAAIVFAAYRFGRQRGMLAVSEAAVSSSEIEGAPWVDPILQWREFSFFGNLVMVFVAIFLLRVAVGFVFGFSPNFCRLSRYPRGFHRRYGGCCYDFYRSPYSDAVDSATKEDVPAS